jgi:hypothetical protein
MPLSLSLKVKGQQSAFLVHPYANRYNSLLPQFPPINKSLYPDATVRGNGGDGIRHLFCFDDIESTRAQGGLDWWELQQILFKGIHDIAKTPFLCYKINYSRRGFSKPAILSEEPKRAKLLRQR